MKTSATVVEGLAPPQPPRQSDLLQSFLASAKKSNEEREGMQFSFPSISPLLSLPPLPRIDHAQQLEAVLRQQGCYETELGLELRKEVLKNLDILVKSWIQSVSLSKGMHWQDIDKIGGRIVTYGSFMLGISHQGADIDALCVAPQHIARFLVLFSLALIRSYDTHIKFQMSFYLGKTTLNRFTICWSTSTR